MPSRQTRRGSGSQDERPASPSQVLPRCIVAPRTKQWWAEPGRSLEAPPSGKGKKLILGTGDSGIFWLRTPRRVALVPHLAVSLDLENLYDARALHEAARERRSLAASAPHVAFREITPGLVRDAIAFLEKFGPLILDAPKDAPEGARLHSLAKWSAWSLGREEDSLVDLEDLWARQEAFAGICGLWEAYTDPRRDLREALAFVLDRGSIYKDVGLPGVSSYFGDVVYLLDLKPADVGGMTVPDVRHEQNERGYLDRDTPDPGEWLARTRNPFALSRLALGLIERALNEASSGLRIGWARERLEQAHEPDGFHPDGIRRGPIRFRARVWADSLWPLLWSFLGTDTMNGIGWRICPHCNNVFYPRRQESMYCTPEVQRRESNREYWHRELSPKARRKRDLR
jgi:hypothetical protein